MLGDVPELWHPVLDRLATGSSDTVRGALDAIVRELLGDRVDKHDIGEAAFDSFFREPPVCETLFARAPGGHIGGSATPGCDG